MTDEVRTKSWARRGKKVNKHRNRDHQYGQGKVHWLAYVSKTDPRNVYGYRSGYYVRLCCLEVQSEHALGGTMSGIGNVPKDEPVTCKICLNLEDML
jgi:hypothetical protein